MESDDGAVDYVDEEINNNDVSTDTADLINDPNIINETQDIIPTEEEILATQEKDPNSTYKLDDVNNKIKKFANSEFSKSVSNITLDSIKMALALVVALAWNTAIKYIINSVWKYDNNNLLMHILYAIVITIVFVAYIMFARKEFGYSGDAKIQYAVVGM